MLRAKDGFYELTRRQRKDICNGAGAKGAWYTRFIPNTLYGLDCKEAFDIHDYGYWAGTTEEERAEIDLDLLINLIALINAEDGLLSRIISPLRRRRALKYYEAVYHHGTSAFMESIPHFPRKMLDKVA